MRPLRAMMAGAATLAALSLGTLLLAGCAGRNVDANYALQGKSDRGLVVASLTRRGEADFDIYVRIRNVDTHADHSVSLDDISTQRDWNKLEYRNPGDMSDLGHSGATEPVGRLAVFELPPGNYEMYNWWGHTSTTARLYIERLNVTASPFSLRFTVRPGQMTYLGNVQIVVPDYLHLYKYDHTYQVEISDTQARDLALLRQKYPALGSTTLAREITADSDISQPRRFWIFIEPFGGGGDHSG